jgi:hypothetical protein
MNGTLALFLLALSALAVNAVPKTWSSYQDTRPAVHQTDVRPLSSQSNWPSTNQVKTIDSVHQDSVKPLQFSQFANPFASSSPLGLNFGGSNLFNSAFQLDASLLGGLNGLGLSGLSGLYPFPGSFQQFGQYPLPPFGFPFTTPAPQTTTAAPSSSNNGLIDLLLISSLLGGNSATTAPTPINLSELIILPPGTVGK